MNKPMTKQTHEGYWDREIAVPSSDRSFGLVMAAAFAVITLINVWHVGRAWPWTGTVAAFFLVFAAFRPATLRPLNWIWFKLGLLLHKVVNPIVMALVFFGAVVPTGLIVRLLGKDLLRLRGQADANSYWIERRPTGPAPESMKDQF
jgi:hypothetical protein